jgi:hypothetical protein
MATKVTPMAILLTQWFQGTPTRDLEGQRTEPLSIAASDFLRAEPYTFDIWIDFQNNVQGPGALRSKVWLKSTGAYVYVTETVEEITERLNTSPVLDELRNAIMHELRAISEDVTAIRRATA